MKIPARIAVCIIRGYQIFISPYLGRNCRFYPTCSRYAMESIERFGLIRGGWLTLCRIVKCGPWHPGGYDPVPEKTDGPDSRGE
ncbi:membrane protein insertion efficiency factor YidD [Dethiosulfovibrio russensis]|uniref:membrane protein insertion efficiency factor YidD n=1 Tax=Dethiosulfovibrio russensis TaxID=133534 RepID=UPI003F6A329D